jgi:hypothetical protein
MRVHLAGPPFADEHRRRAIEGAAGGARPHPGAVDRADAVCADPKDAAAALGTVAP